MNTLRKYPLYLSELPNCDVHTNYLMNVSDLSYSQMRKMMRVGRTDIGKLKVRRGFGGLYVSPAEMRRLVEAGFFYLASIDENEAVGKDNKVLRNVNDKSMDNDTMTQPQTETAVEEKAVTEATEATEATQENAAEPQPENA